ncbi:hypothetical protein QBC41DRAFT_311071 [Cercophora samala]|uniref:Uncharacterized protein n=1 Tax=Cercophora samala TaxID=330535 RepID=A0AA39ZLZ9_9PEZI|nr:hypothetical protein QBC41DRAFT_311071 [Cercophora samala]
MYSKLLVLAALPMLTMARAYPPLLNGREGPVTTTSTETSRPTSPTHTWTATGDSSATGPWDGHYTGIYTGPLGGDDEEVTHTDHYTGIWTGSLSDDEVTHTDHYTGIYTGSATGGCTGVCTGSITAAYSGIYTGVLPTMTGEAASSTSPAVVTGGAGKGVQGAGWAGGVAAGFAVLGLVL